MTLKIYTNNVPRHVIYGYELTMKEAKEFDYLKGEALEFNHFVRYKGSVYDLSEFMSVRGLGSPTEFKDWDGYQSDSFFSGIVIKYVNSDCGEVVVGTYIS